MRRVQVILTCDACMAWHDVEVVDGVAEVAASGGQTLDLCQDHRETMAPFLALVAEWGQSPGRTASVRDGARRRGSTPSPAVVSPAVDDAPGTAAKGPKNRRGGKRARTRNANAVAASTAAPGSFACPLCDATPASSHALTIHLRSAHDKTGAEVFGAVCPVCNHAGTAPGLGTHGRMAHGHTSVAALFAAAEVAGDPHGVIASRVEALGQAARV